MWNRGRQPRTEGLCILQNAFTEQPVLFFVHEPGVHNRWRQHNRCLPFLVEEHVQYLCQPQMCPEHLLHCFACHSRLQAVRPEAVQAQLEAAVAQAVAVAQERVLLILDAANTSYTCIPPPLPPTHTPRPAPVSAPVIYTVLPLPRLSGCTSCSCPSTAGGSSSTSSCSSTGARAAVP